MSLNLSHSLRLYVNIGRIGETHGTYQPRCKKYARQTPGRDQKSVLLPLFIDALITGGITLFDEVRSLLENAGICLDDFDFSKLK